MRRRKYQLLPDKSNAFWLEHLSDFDRRLMVTCAIKVLREQNETSRRGQASTPDCLEDGAGRHLGRGGTCRSTHPQFHWFIRQILLV